MQPFALRRRGPALRLVPAAGSTLPAYIFEAILKLIPCPFGFRLPFPFGLFLPYGRRSLPETRCRGELPDFPPVFEPPLPSRTFLSFGIKALSPTPFGNACFYESPDLPSLPASRKCVTIAARRINVPDPLLPVKLAVPRTSWNQLHDAPAQRRRQYEICVSNRDYLLLLQSFKCLDLWTACA